MFVAAAERTWFAIAPDGNEHDLVLTVGVPARRPGGEWGSEISLGVLEPKPCVICGVDSWQAVEQGMRFIALRLGHFEQDGWRFFWERGGESASPSDLAPNAPRA